MKLTIKILKFKILHLKKALIIRLGQLGDVILTTSVIEELYERNYEIHYLTRKPFNEIFADDFRVKKVFIDKEVKLSELLKEKYSLILDLHFKFKTFLLSKIISPFHSKHYNKRILERRLTLIFKKNFNNKRIYEMYNETINSNKKPKLIVKGEPIIEGDYIVINPTARYSSRIYRHYDKLDKLLENIPIKKVYIGTEKDLHFLKNYEFSGINLIGKTTIREMLLIVKYAKLFVGNDSGISHIASAFNIPSIVFFGPTVLSFGFEPFSDKYKVFQVNDLPCRPCSLHGEKPCKRNDYACLDWIEPEIVFEKILEFLSLL
ncbi:MAG: glycosyltransferase family 9 protein [candidate division WOR-3 bacterium]